MRAVGRKYTATARHLDLGEDDLIGITRNALEAAFVDETTREALLARLDAEAVSDGV